MELSRNARDKVVAAGFVQGRNGRYRYFAIGWNHHLGSFATRPLDAIIEAVADF